MRGRVFGKKGPVGTNGVSLDLFDTTDDYVCVLEIFTIDYGVEKRRKSIFGTG